MTDAEITFQVRKSGDGGYEARAVGYGIFTQADNWEQLKDMLRDALLCHFDEGEAPQAGRTTMQETIQRKTTVLPGGKVEIVCPELEPGQTVDVIVRHESAKRGRSAIEILNSGPERRLFQTAAEVRAYLAQEKASWDR